MFRCKRALTEFFLTAFQPSRPLRILQISDPHLFAHTGKKLLNVDTDKSFKGVIRHIVEHEVHVDAVLATGDIAQDGSPQAYQRFLDLTGPIAPLLRGLPGNHDLNDVFHTVWGEHAHAITDIGRWRLVLLDSCIAGSSAGHVAPNQLDLLRQASDTADDRHVLVAVHHNPIPIGSRWLDGMMIDNGHEVLSALQTCPNVRGLIWGHVHQEFDSVYNFGSTRQALRMLAAPATCVQFRPRSAAFCIDTVEPGYRWLELHDDGQIVTEVVRVAGLDIQPDINSSGY